MGGDILDGVMCECLNNATNDIAMTLACGHQENCKHRPSDREIYRDVILHLCAGIEAWGNLEDGIADEVYDAYKTANNIVTGNIIV